MPDPLHGNFTDFVVDARHGRGYMEVRRNPQKRRPNGASTHQREERS